MSSIQEVIRSIPSERVAFTSASHNYSYGDLEELLQRNSDTIDLLKGSSVAINGRERMEFALLLSILDGQVKKILFLPSDIDSSLHNQYYNEANINLEIYLEDGSLHYNEINSQTSFDVDPKLKTQWIIPTSGTTNIPKLVSHTFESLTRTAKCNIDLGERYRWGLVFDIYRFSGIQVFLQSILAGSALIITESAQSMSEILNTLIQKK